MKKEFLENWNGTTADGRNKWSNKATGSSLSKKEEDALKAGIIVKKEKTEFITKIFVLDEDGHLWSVIIDNRRLAALEDALKEVGYILPPAA